MREQESSLGSQELRMDKPALTLVSEGPKNIIEHLQKDSRFEALFDLSREFAQSRVYIVGGAVRDSLLGRNPKDIDFVVGGVEQDQLEEYLKKRGRVKLVGRQFGVYIFVPFSKATGRSSRRLTESDAATKPDRLEIEIALPRTEQATGQGGYRDVTTQSDPQLPIKDDLRRRDFTINAMALDINTGKTIDPFGGQKDLQNKIIRAVGDPQVRFSEDYSRMLRAVRFSSKFDFEIESETALAIKKMAGRINAKDDQEKFIVARELIGREFIWAFAFNSAGTLENLRRYNLLQEILPEVAVLQKIEQYPIFHPEGNVYTHTLTMLNNLPPEASLNLKLAVLWHDLGKARAVQIKDLKTGERREVPDPVAYFGSGRYDPTIMRVQNLGHSRQSVALAKKMIRRLHLTGFGHTKLFRADYDDVLHNVKYHLLRNIEDMHLTKAEAILFKNGKPRKDLLELARLDVMNKDYSRLEAAQKVVAKLLSAQKTRARARGGETRLPGPLINGRILIKLGFNPGPQFAQMLLEVREKQLSGDLKTSQEAVLFVKKKYTAQSKTDE